MTIGFNGQERTPSSTITMVSPYETQNDSRGGPIRRQTYRIGFDETPRASGDALIEVCNLGELANFLDSRRQGNR